MTGVALAMGLSSQEIQWLFQNSGYKTSRSDGVNPWFWCESVTKSGSIPWPVQKIETTQQSHPNNKKTTGSRKGKNDTVSILSLQSTKL